jgi:MFS family permease
MSFSYLFICLALFAVGDFLGVFTKARISSVFVALILFLIGFMTGILPADIIDQAGLAQLSKWSSAFIVFHMGTMISWNQLIKEWRSVVVSIIAMGVAIIALFAVAPLIGIQAALVSIPVINGGIVATQIMTAGAMEKGLTLAAALGTIVYAVQKFVGTPPASMHGLREAEKILVEYRTKKASGEWQKEDKIKSESREKGLKFYQKYDKYYTDFTCLAVAGLFAWISQVLGKITPINFSIWALLLGATIGFIGLVPPKLLEKGKASGLLSMALFASIIPSLAKINLGDLKTLGFQTIVVFAAVILATYLFMYILPIWKIVGSKDLAVGISMAQLLGFPATFLISNEIATAVAQTPEEKEVVLNRIMPAYVVAGFVSVTSLSIIVAGIFVKFL